MPVKLAGRLPHDKERLVAELEAAKAAAADGTLARYRRSIVSL